jgi:hypothetical protein
MAISRASSRHGVRPAVLAAEFLVVGSRKGCEAINSVYR